MSERGNFASKIGIILATAGSAVGLGNIWRFPYEAGENGGAAFIIIYLCCIFLLGVPAMLCEFVIGRRAQANASVIRSRYSIATHTTNLQSIYSQIDSSLETTK